MKIFLCIFFVTFAPTIQLVSQENDSVSALPSHQHELKLIATDCRTAPSVSHSLNIQPLGILLGGTGVTYEYFFGERNGIMVEGGYAFGNGYTVSGGYRYHYFRQDDEHGLISPFWGFFVHTSKSKGKVEDTDTKKKHTLEIEMFTIGVHWGQRFAWGESFNYAWRIGYGYPITLNFNWPDGKPNGAKTIEGVTRILGGLDSELSIGIVF
jgi:hypothetical protein